MSSKKFNLKRICLITGDCPIIDPKLIENMIDLSNKNDKLDYINNGELGLPNGMGCQIISLSALQKSYLIIKQKDEIEHVSLCIRRNEKIFKCLYVKAEKMNYCPKLSITLDEYEDYILIKKIIEFFFKNKNYYFSCHDIIKLMQNNKSWFLINKHINRVEKKIKFSY